MIFYSLTNHFIDTDLDEVYKTHLNINYCLVRWKFEAKALNVSKNHVT